MIKFCLFQDSSKANLTIYCGVFNTQNPQP